MIKLTQAEAKYQSIYVYEDINHNRNAQNLIDAINNFSVKHGIAFVDIHVEINSGDSMDDGSISFSGYRQESLAEYEIRTSEILKYKTEEAKKKKEKAKIKRNEEYKTYLILKKKYGK